MLLTCITAIAAPAVGHPIDPILAAYLVAAGAPMLLAGLIWGAMSLLATHHPPEPNGQPPTRSRLCPQCGYDVRATPDGLTHFTRCPECGGAIEALP